MKLFELVVTVVGDKDKRSRNSGQQYQLAARSGDDVRKGRLLSEDEYRAAMSGSVLTGDQIESPIRTGSQTCFGGRGGDLLFEERDIEKMGLRPSNFTTPTE